MNNKCSKFLLRRRTHPKHSEIVVAVKIFWKTRKAIVLFPEKERNILSMIKKRLSCTTFSRANVSFFY